jgi:hypothetical protein
VKRRKRKGSEGEGDRQEDMRKKEKWGKKMKIKDQWREK